MSIDPLKLRFRFFKWGGITVAIFLPIASWYVAYVTLELRNSGSMLAIFISMLVSIGIFHTVTNYLSLGFARSYAKGRSWDFLSTNFLVIRKPHDIHHSVKGKSRLEREDVAFIAESGVGETGVYTNIYCLGRIVIPWDSISALRKHNVPDSSNVTQTVEILLGEADINLRIPWKSEFDTYVPNNVGFSCSNNY